MADSETAGINAHSERAQSKVFININMNDELELIDGAFCLRKNNFPQRAMLVNSNSGNVLYIEDRHYYVNGNRIADRQTYKMYVFERCYFIYTRADNIGRFIDLATGATIKEFCAKLKNMCVHDQILCCSISEQRTDTDFIKISDRPCDGFAHAHINTAEFYPDYTPPMKCVTKSNDIVITYYKGHSAEELPILRAPNAKSKWSAPVISGDYIFTKRQLMVEPGKLFTLEKIPSEVGAVYRICAIATAPPAIEL